MTADGELAATDFVTLVLSGLAHETDPTAVNRLPGNVSTAVRLYSDPAHRAELLDTWERVLRGLLVGAAPGSDSQLSFTPRLRRGGRRRAGRRRPRGTPRRLVRARGAGRRRRPALDAAQGPGPHRSRRRRPDRRGAGPRQDHLRSGAGRRGPGAATDRRGQGRGLARRGGERTTYPTRPSAASPPRSAPSGRTRCWRPTWTSTSRWADTIWEDKGTQRGSTVLEYMFPIYLAGPELIERVDDWLATSPANPAAKRLVGEGRDDAARALRAQARDAQR